MVRYDDALRILIETAQDCGIALDDGNSIVLRNAEGRLGLVLKTKPKNGDDVAAKLTAALGAYALPCPLLPRDLFETIAKSACHKYYPGEGLPNIRLADRRIVGMDWLSEFTAPQEGAVPRLVFGSLKGGVGRTTAIAVLAADLARNGRKVLCVDLDLEAPGLGSMLLRHTDDDDRRPKYGVIDYLVENGLGGVPEEDLYDHIGVSHFSDGAIHVLPAVGRVTDEHPENFIGKLSRALVEDMRGDERISVAAQLDEMLTRFIARESYDAVLIDARAGLSETTASTWLGLRAHRLILFGADQTQTFQGYRYVLSHLMDSFGVPEGNDWRERVGFVQSKAPNLSSQREIFRDRLYELCAECLYDQEDDQEDMFNFSLRETGSEVPHDATWIEYHPAYDAFDPIGNVELLEPDAYRGPFGAFLKRSWQWLELERTP
jgi:hypothetical protein